MNKKICMIAYTNYPMDNRVRREAEALIAAGYRVSVLVPKEQTDPEQYALNGVEIRELNVAKYQGKSNRRYLQSYIHFLIRAFLVCNGLLLKEKTDIFHIHNMPNFLVFAAIVPRIFGKKLILDLHDTMIETYTAKFRETSNNLFFRFLIGMLRVEEAVCIGLVHSVICVNHIQKESVVKRGVPEKKITVCLNVPDPSIFSPEKGEAADRENGSFRMIYHGTLAKRLGIDIALRALARSLPSMSTLEYHVVGAGDDRSEFIALAEELGLGMNVTFREGVPLDKVASIVKGMDLGVVANRNNIATELMLPVKMLEYISLNIPVIVPRLKTIQYYFTDDMVFYFDPEDEESLSRAMLEAAGSPELRRQKARRAQTFLDRYGWFTHKYDLIDMYEALWPQPAAIAKI